MNLEKSSKNRIEELNRVRREREIVDQIKKDYQKRAEERKSIEKGWLLNINFVMGNQYSYINPNGEIEDVEKTFSWESREVFNHIAPIVESRLAKLYRVRPTMGVRPSSNEKNDLETAKLSKLILESVSNTLNINKLVADATLWSEVTGSVFYKIFWDTKKGNVIGYFKDGKLLSKNLKEQIKDRKDVNSSLRNKNDENFSDLSEKIEEVGNVNFKENVGKSDAVTSDIKSDFSTSSKIEIDDEKHLSDNRSFVENGFFIDKNNAVDKEKSQIVPIFDGDVNVSVCSPFEIFPDSCGITNFEDVQSIIHARVVDCGTVKELYGVDCKPEDLDTLTFVQNSSNSFYTNMSNFKVAGSVKHNQTLVLERWEKPTKEFENGRLQIVAGEHLVYDGELPDRIFPFVKQVSYETIGNFWGTSIIDRCIPIQRAYNAIKNRKLEFLSRLSAGVLAVEDGSVDIDDLEIDGLAPGKILVYRNGSNLPKFMDSGDIPNEFSIEEERLLNEFVTLTGVSELMRNSALPTNVTSGTAISLLIEQDDTRLSVPAEHIRKAILEISKMILNLYKKYADVPKLSKIVDDNGDVQIFYWRGSEINADDVVLETSNELSESLSSRRAMALELLKNGLLYNENGKLSERMRVKILDMLGFGNWESAGDNSALHIRRATSENLNSLDLVVLEIDNHDLHIAEHTRYILEKKLTSGTELEKLLEHIRMHKKFNSINLKNITEI